ncbi:MAG: hypothetical protein ACI4UN_09915 [Muribaculaceae bacterium]
MIKQLFLSMALALSAAAAAQVLEVESVTPLKLQGAGRSVVTGVSPKGDYLLLSDAQLNGLAKYDLATNRIEVISQARSAGLNAAVSADGSCVAYREDSFKGGLRYTDVKVRSFATGTTKQLLKGARNVNGVSLQGNTAVTIANGEAKKTAVTGKVAKKTAPVASVVNRQLVLTTNGTSKTLSPLGTDRSYLWPSVSPDGKHICFFVAGTGCYISDLKGNIVARLGKLHAAKWLNNTTVVGMNDSDDGHKVTSSSIVAATIDGKSQVLTDASMKAMYPYPAGKMIVFSTDEGSNYIINIK